MKFQRRNFRKHLVSAVAPAMLGLTGLTITSMAAAAPCQGPGAIANTQTKCLTAIAIDGAQLTSFDISFVNPERAEYYLGDRSTMGVDIIDTQHLKFVRTAGLDKPFQGVVIVSGRVNNAKSGPAGVASHGRWLYAGDGNSTLHVIDLDSPPASETKQVISTGGSFRVDEMALTTDGKFLIAANNADDPSFVTLFAANGDSGSSAVTAIQKTFVDPAILPIGFGLGIEQPAWDPKTKRFYTSIPIIANNPVGCNFGQLPAGSGTPCSGGLLVTDPHAPGAVQGAFDPVTNVGVIPLNSCGPNGTTVGVHDNLLLGCTPGNYPPGTTTLVINATTHNYAQVAGITGSDEVWFNAGDSRYYLGASGAIKPAGSPLGRGSVLGVVDGTSVLIETIPTSSGSHSVAADSKRNLIFVPETYTSSPTAVPLGDQNFTAGAGSPTVGQLVCGSTNGCIAVYKHAVKDHIGKGDDDQGDNNQADK
jgi:hypothetical protein